MENSHKKQFPDENFGEFIPNSPITMKELQVPIGGNVLPPSNNQNIKITPDLQMGYLKMMEDEPLNWVNGSFNYPGMVRIGSDQDGSCFFHSIALAYFRPYRKGEINGVAMNRRDFIRDLRHDLAIKLGEKIGPNSKTHYDSISRSNLKDFSMGIPQYTLKSMQDELKSDRPVDNIYNEFISDVLNKDIYLLDILSQDVYVTGDDFDILYKGRDTIVILYISGHYETVGLRTHTGIKTLFDSNHEFIQAIRDRLREKIFQGSN